MRIKSNLPNEILLNSKNRRNITAHNKDQFQEYNDELKVTKECIHYNSTYIQFKNIEYVVQEYKLDEIVKKSNGKQRIGNMKKGWGRQGIQEM